MKLIRISKSSQATYGVLLQGRIPFAVTLELPWRDNEPNNSCIPLGFYRCRRGESPRFGETFEVMDVPGRSRILFHKGNLWDDTEGCILVGESFNPVTGKPGITSSKEGFEEFMNILKWTEEFQLEITEVTEVADGHS